MGEGRRNKRANAKKGNVDRDVAPDFLKNSRGGIKVTARHIEPAWRFIQDSKDPMNEYSQASDDSDTLAVRDIHKLMRCIYPKLTLKESSWILKDKDTLTRQELLQLVKDNAEADFD